MSSDFQEYSFIKFISQYFYNQDLVIQNTEEVNILNESKNEDESSSDSDSSGHSESNCDHRVHRDLIRTFTMRGIKIKIKFRKTDTYAIDILKFRDIDNTQYFKSLFLEEFDIIKENFPVCMKNIHEEFQVLKSILSRVIKHPDIIFNFIDFYQEISNIVHAVENNFEEFEIDAFREIERYASIENNKNNVFDIILLRKRFYIELFNYICLIYKSKRALRKIFDSQKKFEVKAAKSTSNREGRGRHQKQENSISIMRNKEANDSASKMSPNMALSPKQNTMLDENNIILPELSQQSKKDSMKLNDVLSIDHPTNEFDFCESKK